MKYLYLKGTDRNQIAIVRGETVRDTTFIPPLNELVAVAMMFVGAMMVFIS